jgi:hypothetical protein
MSNPDRLYYSRNARKIVEQIDDMKFLDLHNSSTSRLDLFLFAMSLGIDVPMDLEKPESFVLGQTIKSEYEDLLYAVCIANHDESGDFNETIDKGNVYEFAQKCANAGFHIIENMMQDNPNLLELKFISELDDLYEKNIASTNS